MNQIKKFAIWKVFIFSALCAFSVSAQDIHFSQFYQSPLNLNPALTGVMNCTQRFVANYRSQWAGVAGGANAYNTYSASYDQKIAVGQTDYFGVGGTFWGDVAGELNFGTTQGRLSGSFAKFMGGDRKSSNYLSVGVDAALTQRRVRDFDARWPSQHNGNGGFDAGLPGEVINNPDFLFLDLSAGLIWFSVLDENNSFYAGAAIGHLNQANISFLNDDVSLYNKYTVHAGGEFAMGESMSILPGAIALFQGPHREYNGGANVRFKLGDGRTAGQFFQVGAWMRMANNFDGSLTSDAIILLARLESGNYGVGFSYDWTISELTNGAAGTPVGAFEFSFTYLICNDLNRGVYCPTF